MGLEFQLAITALLLAFLGGRLSADEAKVSHEPLILTEGGTAEKPAVFDGKGMVIDLGTDVSGHAWKKGGDLWTSDGPLLGRAPIAVPALRLRRKAARQGAGRARFSRRRGAV